MRVPWLLLQLSDSALPTGGFAHSGGLEAMSQQRELAGPDDLTRWLQDIKATVGPPYHFTAVYIALSDPHGLAKPPPGVVERFSQYNYRIWDASEWMAR